MKWFKSWYFGFALLWIIILIVAWIKGNIIEVMKTPLGLGIYGFLSLLALTGFTAIILGMGQLIRKTIIKITADTNLVSLLYDKIGEWLIYAAKNRGKSYGIYYLFIGGILLTGSYFLMNYLLDIKFLIE